MKQTFFDPVNSKCVSAERDEWISVKDGLPNKEESVLIVYKMQYMTLITAAKYHKVGSVEWWTPVVPNPVTGSNLYSSFITHWMPLPKPPKETYNDEQNLRTSL